MKFITQPTRKQSKVILDAIELALAENPAWKLLNKYSRRMGELPEITGTGISKFGRWGDDILERKEFCRFNGDEQAVLRAFNEGVRLAKQRTALREMLKHGNRK